MCRKQATESDSTRPKYCKELEVEGTSGPTVTGLLVIRQDSCKIHVRRVNTVHFSKMGTLATIMRKEMINGTVIK